jgi:hypothetical protein
LRALLLGLAMIGVAAVAFAQSRRVSAPVLSRRADNASSQEEGR